MEESSRSRSLFRCIDVIRFQPKALKVCSDFKDGTNLCRSFGRSAVDCSKQYAELLEVLSHDLAREQSRFPILMPVRYRLHRHQMIRRVFPEEPGRGSGWGQAIEPAESLRFYPDPFRAAEPVCADPSLC